MNIKTFTKIACTLILFNAPKADAGAGHSHDGSTHEHHKTVQMIDENSAIIIASRALAILVEQKQSIAGEPLNAAWKETAQTNKKVKKKGHDYYIISFDHNEFEESLYILLSNKGELYDANYSGHFEGLK